MPSYKQKLFIFGFLFSCRLLILAARNPDEVEAVDITAQEGLEGVYTVSDYDRDFQMYLYTFEKAGVLYTFYFNAAGESDFVMYAMEKA